MHFGTRRAVEHALELLGVGEGAEHPILPGGVHRRLQFAPKNSKGGRGAYVLSVIYLERK